MTVVNTFGPRPHPAGSTPGPGWLAAERALGAVLDVRAELLGIPADAVGQPIGPQPAVLGGAPDLLLGAAPDDLGLVLEPGQEAHRVLRCRAGRASPRPGTLPGKRRFMRARGRSGPGPGRRASRGAPAGTGRSLCSGGR